MIPEHQLTGWFSGRTHEPAHIGEYIAGTTKKDYLFRWWDGVRWSQPYLASFSDGGKGRLRREKTHIPNDRIYFRGLKHKPKVSTLSYLRPLQD